MINSGDRQLLKLLKQVNFKQLCQNQRENMIMLEK